MLRNPTSGAAYPSVSVTLTAGALAQGVGTGSGEVHTLKCQVGDQIDVQPEAGNYLAGLLLQAGVTAENTVRVWAYCIAAVGVTIPANYRVRVSVCPS